jgi:hypothetical protein
MMDIAPPLFARSLREADEGPIGRPVAGCLEVAGIHKGFQQPQRVLEVFGPVLAQLSNIARQHVRGEMGHLDPG